MKTKRNLLSVMVAIVCSLMFATSTVSAQSPLPATVDNYTVTPYASGIAISYDLGNDYLNFPKQNMIREYRVWDATATNLLYSFYPGNFFPDGSGVLLTASYSVYDTLVVPIGNYVVQTFVFHNGQNQIGVTTEFRYESPQTPVYVPIAFVQGNNLPFSLAPNPVSNYLGISGLAPGVSEIKIIDLTGKTVLQQKLSLASSSANTIRLDVSHLKNGIYLASAGGHTVKFVKN